MRKNAEKALVLNAMQKLNIETKNIYTLYELESIASEIGKSLRFVIYTLKSLSKSNTVVSLK